MGKKIKKKGRSSQKERRVSSGHVRGASERSNPIVEIGKEEFSIVKERKSCSHIDRGVDLDKLQSGIKQSTFSNCKDCRDSASDKRVCRGKGRQGKKKTMRSNEANSELQSIWVCLSCGHFACGGSMGDSEPQSHALRHSRQTRHPCAVQLDDPLFSWCFMCKSSVSIEQTEEGSEGNRILYDVQELIKGRSMKGAEMDVEDVWFGGNVGDGSRSESRESSVLDMKGYTVRGLVNLGNTCFFNSVMQNLLAMDILRDYFVNLDRTVGPLTMALKKLFSETSIEADSKNGINPKTFFGCICSKAPQFRGYQQQDSHELLRYLLDGLYNEELGARKSLVSSVEDKVTANKGPTFVDVIFGGQLSSTLCCVECGHSSIVYEPFLDLSLPVPMKKTPSRKIPVVRPKKTKFPLKEGSKGGKNRGNGKTNAAPKLTQCTAGSTSLSAECSESSTAGSASLSAECSKSSSALASKSHVAELPPASVEEEGSSWLDYIGPDTGSLEAVSQTYDDSLLANSPFQSSDTSIILDSENSQAFQHDNIIQSNSESARTICSLNSGPEMVNECAGEKSCGDEISLFNQDSEVILLPYKEIDISIEETQRMTYEFQSTGDVVVKDDLSKDFAAGTSFINGGEENGDFDGFGDLFNEPETVSRAESSFDDMNNHANEEIETTLLAGNSSESNQDEVDNTNAQVSIDGCLAYFTKPELLSNEHAWDCENCSKTWQSQKMGSRGVRRKSAARDNKSKTLESSASGGGIRTKHASPCRDHNCLRVITSDDGQGINGATSSTASDKLEHHVEKLNGAETSVQQGLISLTGEPNCTICEYGQVQKETCLELSDPVSNGSSHHTGDSQQNQDFDRSNHAEQDLLRNSDVLSGVQASVLNAACSQLTTGASRSLVDDGEAIPLNSGEEDTFGNVEKNSQKDSNLSGGQPASDNSKAEEFDSSSRKVKRDATKRILISKAPPILTIHLKRFGQDARGRLNKLSGHVSFRETLDLRPYTDPRCGEKEKCWYRLIGVVEHSGTMRGGHYVAYIRGKKNGGKAENKGGSCRWFYASDAYVREVSVTEVLQSEAYILFYERI